MALDRLVDSAQLNSDLASIANAIRAKGGANTQITFPNGFVSAIQNIPSDGGSAPSAALHSIYLEFSDHTNTMISVYYNDTLISSMITAYEPTTYGQKTVTLAQLDGATWYESASS